MATDKTPSSKHGRLHEEEAKREEFKPAAKTAVAPDAGGYSIPEGWKFAQFKPDKAKPAPKTRPDITQRMDALRSALSDKYPHNEVQVIPEGLKVAVPTGHITIESEKVAACADNAAIRAYIDALPIQ